MNVHDDTSGYDECDAAGRLQIVEAELVQLEVMEKAFAPRVDAGIRGAIVMLQQLRAALQREAEAGEEPS